MRILAAIAALSLAACSGESDIANETAAEEAAEAPAQSLSEAIPGDSRFAQAMEAAGLGTLFEGPEPYTVLLPSDDAFPDDLPEDAEELASILTLHILPGTILAEDIERALAANEEGIVTLPSYGGADLTVSREGDGLTVGAGGTPANLTAGEALSDGALHRIDGLLTTAS